MRYTLLIFMLITLQSIYPQRSMRYHNYSVNDGLSQYDVSQLTQDEYGFMWVGTYDGLNRYDGVSNYIYRVELNDSGSINSNRVRCVEYDKYRKKMWVGTNGGGINIYDYGSDSFSHFYFSEEISSNDLDNDILDIDIWQKDQIWVITQKSIMLVCLNDEMQIEVMQRMILPLRFNNFRSIAQIDNNTLCVTTQNGVMVYKSSGGDFVYSHRCNTPAGVKIKTLQHLAKDGTYLSTSNGLYYSNNIQDKDGTFRRLNTDGYHQRDIKCMAHHEGSLYYVTDNAALYRAKINNGNLLSITNLIEEETIELKDYRFKDIYIDRSNTLWISTTNRGLTTVDLLQKPICKLAINPNKSPHVSRLAFDQEQNLWVTTIDNGAYVVTNKSKQILNFLKGDLIFNISFDLDDRVCLIGQNGIYRAEDTHITASTQFKEIYPGDYQFADSLGIAFSATYDSFNNLWLGCHDGVVNIRKDGHRIIKLNPQNHTRVYRDEFANRIWVSTNQDGVYQLELDAEGLVVDIIRYDTNNDEGRALSSNVVSCFEQGRDGVVYIGTDVGLNIIDPNKHIVEFVSNETPISNAKILSIIEIAQDELWVNTNQGLYNYNIITHSYTGYNSTDGLTSNSLTEAGCVGANNILYVGGNQGVNYVDLNALKLNEITPKVNISEFRLFNNKVNAGDEVNGRVVLSEPILETHDIKLNYNQNSFTLRFCSDLYNNTQKNRYLYRLVGFDSQWYQTNDNLPEVSYSNLRRGRYTFEVKGLNNDGVISEDIRRLDIRIKSAPWSSIWAYMIYILIVSMLSRMIYRQRVKEQRQKHQTLINKIHMEAETKLNETKLRFYTNITHELRTPLTLISAPLDELIEQSNDSENSQQKLYIMRKNCDRLIELINQFLDLRKIENNRVPLCVERCSITDLTNTIHQRFTHYRSDVKFTYNSQQEPIYGWIDRDKIMCILTNLLSNAFKFTSSGGSVTFSISRDERECIFIVEDTGCGIESSKLPYIFERFYQVDDKRSSAGTGIGLELVKRLAELHLGEVHVASELGVGTMFRVIIPIDKVLYPEDVCVDQHQKGGFDGGLKDERSLDEETSDQTILLLVEDDLQMRSYISSLLSPLYRVIEAADGVEGLDMALRHSPDIILSDVMMPNMDGIEMCSKVKENVATSHIPVIMLTAKSGESIGLEAGAVDYIMKPFVAKNLLLKIQNTLNIRGQNQKIFNSKRLVRDKIVEYKETREREFMQKVYDIVYENLSDESFGVDNLIALLAISRTHLHRKIVALTGDSTSTLIRNIRLDEAHNMLVTGRYTVTEVFYRVGFSNHSYFSKTYKERFGSTPTDTLQN